MRRSGPSASSRRRAGGGGGGGGGSSSSYRPFTSASAFNTPIPASPTYHPNSSAWISSANGFLLGGTSNDAYKEWLGPRPRLLYWSGDTTTLSTVPIYQNWSPTSGYVCATTKTLNMPMPSGFSTILAGTSSSVVDADRICVVVDSITGDVWECYHLTPPGTTSMSVSCSTSRWNSIATNHYKTDTTLGNGYTELSGSTQIGFASESYCHAIAGALIPEDFVDLTNTNPIPHAITCAWNDHSNSNGTGGSGYPKFTAPARAGLGFNSTGMPYGVRLQLDPSLDIDNWTSINAKSDPWKTALKKICKALQVYGLILVDGTGGPGAGGITSLNKGGMAQGVYNGSSTYKFPWDVAGYGWSYANGIPYDLMTHLKVLDFRVWTGA